MLKLICHPNIAADRMDTVNVTVVLDENGVLKLSYEVAGDIDNLLLAPNAKPLRTDYLWHHTCFECFITREGQTNYIEYNLCPSTRWAAYKFSDYRKDAADLDVPADPVIQCHQTDGKFSLEAKILLPEDWREGEMRMGITTILEEPGDKLSYWALKHPGEKQEFHDRSCFIHKLQAAT